jgi:hypothetical protein
MAASHVAREVLPIDKERAMQNGPKTTVNKTANSRQPQRQWSRTNRIARSAARPDTRGAQSAQKNYERYLALAQAEIAAGDVIGAENYFQHAEHYFRTMTAERTAQ